MELDLPRVLAGLVFLTVAAGMDVRRREVKDGVWVALGALGLGLATLDAILMGIAPALYLMVPATAILFFGVLLGTEMWTEEGFRVRPGRFILYLSVPAMIAVAWWTSVGDPNSLGAFYRLLTMPGMIVIAHGMYQFNLLRGGADAKALMAVALLFPGIYPQVGPLPLGGPDPIFQPLLAVMFPFAFVVLVNAALLFLAAPVLFLARNVSRRTVRLPRAVFGYVVPIDAVPRFVWLMDRVEGDDLVTAYFPRQDEDREGQLRKLQDRGLREVWVTPQLPFIVAILAGFLLATAFGNPILAAFGGLG